MLSARFCGTLDEAIEATKDNFGITCMEYDIAKLFLGYIRNKGYSCEALELTDEELHMEYKGCIKEFKKNGNVITYGYPISTDYFIILEREDFK